MRALEDKGVYFDVKEIRRGGGDAIFFPISENNGVALELLSRLAPQERLAMLNKNLKMLMEVKKKWMRYALENGVTPIVKLTASPYFLRRFFQMIRTSRILSLTTIPT